MTRRLLLCVTLFLASAGSASAHATFLRSSPRDGAALAHAPRAVRVVFDEGVRVGPRNAAVAAGGRSVLAAPPRLADRAHTLVLPLRPLRRGTVSVRWSAVSDDGHQEEGVLAFSVGTGRAPAAVTLTARGIVTWQRALSRALFFLGILGAGGAAAFGAGVLRPLGLDRELLRPHAHVLFFAFLLAFLGSDSLIHTGSAGGTRFQQVVQVAATLAAVGGAAAALAPLYPRLRFVAWAAAAGLVVCPTLSGHALDPDQPRVLAPVVDVAHLAAAAVWFGGLASLAVVAARAEDGVRRRAVGRFSAWALGAVVVVAATGVGRALMELAHVSQLWSLGYGRAILVKTAIFVPLLGLGWLNRAALLDAFARLRRSMLVELTLLTGVLIAVAVLTDLRPGRVAADAGRASVGAAPSPARPPLPPRGAFVDAREAGSLAVALAVGDGKATVTVLRSDGTGARGLHVVVDGFRGRPCGAGCYRTIAASTPSEVRIGRRTLEFRIPLRLYDARRALRRATHAFESLRTVTYDERLASSPTNTQLSTFELVAPDRLAYRIRGGASAIVIGSRRWDRSGPGEPWVASAQTPLRVPEPYWSSAARNAYFVAPNVFTFLDPRLPAWFRVRVDRRTGRPLELRMVAAAHFMTDRYSRFDRPLEISPPSR